MATKHETKTTKPSELAKLKLEFEYNEDWREARKRYTTKK